MSHIVLIAKGLSGVLNAECALGRLLREAGHRVTCASPADVGAHVAARGLDYVQLPASGRPPRDESDAGRDRRDRVARALGVDALADTLRALGADGLLIELELHAHVIASASLTLPTALLSTFVCPVKGPNVPPLHHRTVPGVGWRGSRPGIEGAWAAYRVHKWIKRHQRRLKRRGADRVSVLRRLAAETGFDFAREVDFGQWLDPLSYRRLPVLCMCAEAFDLPHDAGPLQRYTGPLVERARRDHQTDAATADRLDALYARRAADPDRRLVLCSMSTVAGGDAGFLRRVAEAARTERGWDVVIGLGGRLDPDALGVLPPNVHAFSWIPQMQVLEHADAAVTNAGPNSITECILLGVPMVVYSLDVNDQNGNAARVAFHRLGIVGRAGDAATAIRDHVRRVLDDATYRASVDRMRASFEADVASGRAVRETEAALTRTPS